MRLATLLRTTIVAAALLALSGAATAEPAKAPRPAAKGPGPATKMKVVEFVTLETAGILKLQFHDKAGKPTQAPEGGEISYTTNITNPRKGTATMAKARWDKEEQLYVVSGLAPRQRIVCPPRSYFIRVNFKAGKKRFSANKTTKLNCI